MMTETEYYPGEPYEFYESRSYLSIGPVLVYRCFRGACKGVTIWVADRNTHNNYHNHVDNGLPNSYSLDDDYDNDWEDYPNY